MSLQQWFHELSQANMFKREIALALQLDVHDKLDETVLLSRIRKPAPGVY